MIKTKNDLKRYLEQDRIQLGMNRKKPRIFSDEIWRYQITLRKYEYYLNNVGLLNKLLRYYYKIKWHKLSVQYGLFIPPNVCEEGLSIAHMPGIVINDQAQIGKNVRIHEGVTIGASGGNKAPVIKDEVFLSTGCKIVGDVLIEERCVVGAGAVVVNNIYERGITVAGVPAKKVSDNSSEKLVYWYKKESELK